MSKRKDQAQLIVKEKRNLLIRTLLTGFIGGFILGLTWVVFNYFNFVQFNPHIIVLHNWIHSEWAINWIGSSITILVMGLISIVISLLYYVSFKKINSLWVGMIYGFIIWLLIFFLISIPFPEYKVNKLDSDTIVSTLSIFVLYGVFIGYSISYDYYRIQVDIMGQRND